MLTCTRIIFLLLVMVTIRKYLKMYIWYYIWPPIFFMFSYSAIFLRTKVRFKETLKRLFWETYDRMVTYSWNLRKIEKLPLKEQKILKIPDNLFQWPYFSLFIHFPSSGIFISNFSRNTHIFFLCSFISN